jgi:NosR/NirI family nitrous oxide reductase transcriptional regulator
MLPNARIRYVPPCHVADCSPKKGHLVRLFSFWFGGLIVFGLQVLATGPTQAESNFARLFQSVDLKTVYPGAERVGKPLGDPPVAPVIAGGKTVGHIFLNSDFAGATGYSGAPINIFVGIDTNGVIAGAQLVEHHEPIVLIGIPEKRIRAVIEGYIGRNIISLARGEAEKHEIDIVSGATVTVMVIDDSILRSSIKVARRLELGGLQPEVTQRPGPQAIIDTTRTGVVDWAKLIADGSVSTLRLALADINEAFSKSSDLKAGQRPEDGEPDETFIEFHAALVSVPVIGESLLGAREYENLKKALGDGQSAILLMGRGRYSFRGSGFVRGGIFDRFQLIQGDSSIRFRDKNYERLRSVAAKGAPNFPEVALFTVPADTHFDPVEPWRIELLVGRATGATSKAFLTFDMPYTVPEQYLKLPPVETEAASQPATAAVTAHRAAGNAQDQGPPLWQRLWRQKIVQTVILAGALLALTIVFFAQEWITRDAVLVERLRIGFLVFTLFGLGFYANAQLSVVNVMTFFNALITDFRWDYFLMEPLIFLLWFSVAASLLLWGRGAYCGWLCPFGALQELLNKLAKWSGLRQIEVPWWLHERAWAIKYMIFLVLFGMSLYSLSLAERMAEVEPFKTAIILKFWREWPFVLFALAVLGAGLFIERFYCRYICPLGAALAIPGRMRLFDWLKRYKQCGSPCQKCAGDCMVQSIHPEGHINPNECLYCLHCQVVYHDTERCPVVIQHRLRAERLEPAGLIASRALTPRTHQSSTTRSKVEGRS